MKRQFAYRLVETGGEVMVTGVVENRKGGFEALDVEPLSPAALVASTPEALLADLQKMQAAFSKPVIKL